MRYERRADVLVYKGQERPCRTLAWWCTQCGEAIFAGKPLLARDPSRLREIASGHPRSPARHAGRRAA
jgi:hypothetical protein